MEVYNKNELNNSNNSKSNKKRIILIGIIICIVLIIVLACLVLFYRDLDSKTFKLYINGTQVSCSDDFYIQDESGNTYVKAKELASLIGWTYQNGEYGSYTEDTSSGYLQNEYEVASLEADSTTLKKYIDISEEEIDEEDEDDDEEEEEGITVEISVYSEDGSLEISELDLPVLSSNDQLYIPFSNIQDICNCVGSYENYRMYINDMNYLIELALQNAYSYGYSSVSGTYENLKALAYGMMVVVNKSGNYGVVNLYTNEQILGFKYTDMVFYQNVKEFLVKAENTVGIVSSDGTVIIAPKNYDNISMLDDKLGLYLIEKDYQYGILNREGDTIVYPEYDSIGLSDEAVYVFNNIDNKYVLYDNTIIVEQNGKYGLYNLEGDNVLAVNFEGIGYISDSDNTAYEKSLENESSTSSSSTSSKDEDSSSTSSTQKTGDSVLTIDVEIELDDGSIGIVQGIVVEQKSLDDESVYGIYDAIQEKLIIPCGCSRIYSITKSGVTTYYMEFNGEQIEFTNYIKQQGLYTLTDTNTDSTDENLSE